MTLVFRNTSAFLFHLKPLDPFREILLNSNKDKKKEVESVLRLVKLSENFICQKITGLNKGSGVLSSAHTFNTDASSFLSKFNYSVPKYSSRKYILDILHEFMHVIFTNIMSVYTYIYTNVCIYNDVYAHTNCSTSAGIR